MKPRTQIVYTPGLEKGNLKPKDVEYGFVVEPEGEYFHRCFFWSKTSSPEMTRKKTPEMVPNHNLTEKNSVPQALVDRMMAKLGIK